MRAVFKKEFLQGRPLLVFAAIMAVLVPLAYTAFARAAFLYVSGYDPRLLPMIFGFVVLGVPLLIAILSSAGLFSGEAHHGTLPILFALPLSRGRIWLAKLLAALALTIVGSLLVLVIGGALLPGPYRDLPIRYHLLELCCCVIFLLAVGAFCSSLSRSINSALPTTLLLAGALSSGAAALRFYYGAPLVGPPWLDIALWCALTSPALLLGSALVVTRGELLQSARKWLYGLPVALLAAALIVLLAIAVGRATTTYDRSGVRQVAQVTDPDGGRAVCLFSHARPFRSLPRWLVNLMVNEQGVSPREVEPDDLPLLYRANYVIALDLATGRELSIARAPLDSHSWTRPPADSAACSHDGRLAALINQPAGLTWGVRRNRPLKLQILDIEQDKVLYSGWPDKVLERAYDLSWSPSGNYLVLSSRSYGSRGGDKHTMYFLNRDGSQSRPGPLILRSPSWAPDEGVMYGFDNEDNLCRAYPDDRRTEVIWSPQPEPEGAERKIAPQALSPNGKWFALLEEMWVEPPEVPARRSDVRTQALHLIPTAGGPSEVAWREDRSGFAIGGMDRAAWSSNSRLLYLLLSRRDDTSSMTFHRLLCWNRQTGETTWVGPEHTVWPSTRLLTRPGSDQVVLWGLQYDWSREPGRMPEVVGGTLALADSSGGWRPLPSPEESSRFATEHEPIGFDSQGRLVLLARAEGYTLEGGQLYRGLEALNLDTGATEHIYP